MFYVKKDFVKTVLFKMIVAMLSLEKKGTLQDMIQNNSLNINYRLQK